MMPKKLTFIAAALLFAVALPAQSWKKLSKSADDLFEQGNYAQAAQTYEQAWQKKQKKTELMFKAGEAYYLIRDYRKAAESYQYVKDDNNDYPLVGLKYARSLKQDKQYEKASDAFNKFLDSYTGDGKAILEDVVKIEIEGCQYAKNLPAQANKEIELVYPGTSVNSDADEFAPFAVTGDYLYFSSSMGGKARVYASQRQGSKWSKASIPGNFPVITNGQYSNASLSPDGQRMYFTICNNDKNWERLNTRCEIFVTKKVGATWSQPERLPDYINMKGVNTTHPFSVFRAGQEILYFASNREGGRGGLDIWFTTRDLGGEGNDFAFPVNVGPSINTLGDEISPFYDQEEEVLYFASNGQVSIGGFDIFKSVGDEASWSVPENLGLPFNSGADDYFFVKTNAGHGGFLASNRVFGGEKTNTTNDDIYEFTIGGRRISLKANVYDKSNGEPLKAYKVELYQVFEDGSENMLIEKEIADGGYLFELLPNRTFRVQVLSNGYEAAEYQFVTNDPNTYSYGQPLFLQKMEEDVISLNPTEADPMDDTENTDPLEVDKPVKTYPAGAPYTARGTSPKDNKEYVTTAPKHTGVYYKIQLTAVKKYDPNHKKIKKAGELGRIDTEELNGSQLTRILVGDFFTEEEATNALSEIQAKGLDAAFIVKYEDGVRFGRVNF
ncbi:MAG: PD40 domain-containing protein [Saprospiraceae bacterium]|nr:PD40 domain-containing protein [Saprospiraceae bacterium]MCB9324572.1 PD40 domain-containing protein [Lewinellaceae bacterium]